MRIFILSFIFFSYSAFATFPICQLSQSKIETVSAVIAENPKLVKNLKRCHKKNIKLMSLLINQNPHNLKYANSSLKSNPSFVKKFIILDYELMQYIAKDLKDNSHFILSILGVEHRILGYVSKRLLNNFNFAKKAIELNPRSYIYISDKLQKNKKLAIEALLADGSLFPNIPESLLKDKDIIRAALDFYPLNTELINEKILKKKDIKNHVINFDKNKNYDLAKFLKEQYQDVEVGPNGIRGYKITNQGVYSRELQILHKEYPLIWQYINLGDDENNYKLAINGRLLNNWKKDFEEYPDLIKKIEEILRKRNINNSVIDSLSTISLWRIDSNKILAFNLYSLRNIDDQFLDKRVANISSFTAIAINQENGWNINIIDAIYDKNIKMSIEFAKGHKRYYIWDIILNKEFNLPYVIFKVEDRNSQYFEIYQKTSKGNFVQIFKNGGFYENINIIDY